MEKSQYRNPYECDLCNYGTINRADYRKHLKTRKHITITINNSSPTSSAPVPNKGFECEPCNYQCKTESEYNRHVKTTSHIVKLHGVIECSTCNKIFANESGLWKHSKKCLIKSKHTVEEQKEIEKTALLNSVTPELFFELARNNTELCQVIKESHKLVELALKNGGSNNNNTSNSHNKNYNIQLFLNETCKDALNFSEFMNTIKLSLEDLEKTGQLGYVEGMSRILVNALNKTTLEKRPLHCTDIKKETVYIKESNKWDKENKEKENLNRAIQYISERNLGKIREWKEENPESMDSNSEKSEVLNQLYANVMSRDDERDNNRIIKKVLSEVVIDPTADA